MKKIRNTFQFVLLLLATLFATNSCSDVFNNPMQDKETGEDLTLLLLDMNFFDTKVTFYFVDSAGNAVTEPLKVAITGDDADKIVDFEGNKKTQYDVDNGYLEVALDPNYTPTDEEPIAITIAAWNAGFRWMTPPQDIVITTTGIIDEKIELNHISDEDVETGETELLKSVQIGAPFTVSIATNPIVTKSKITMHEDNGQYIYYDYYLVSGSNPYKIQVKAYDLTDNLISKYGFDLAFFDENFNYLGSGGRLLGSDGATSDIFDKKIQSIVIPMSEKDVTRCNKGMTVKFNGVDKKNASAKFNYILTFSDGTTKKGIATMSERVNPYTKESLGYYAAINNLYIPNTTGPSARIQIVGDSQYDLEYQSSITDVCGAELAVTVKPKTATFSYDLSVVINCESGAVGAAPSLLATYWKEGNELQKTTVNFSGGSINLQLEKNQNYNITGSYLGESRTFGFSTNPSTAQSFGDAIAASEKGLKTVKINVTDPTATSNGKIAITVTYLSSDCPF